MADRLRLVVEDDGIGMPPELDVVGTRSLGLRLVHTLVGQLHATLDIRGRPGARFELTFRAEDSG